VAIPILAESAWNSRGDEIGGKRDPEQFVAVSRAGLDIRSKISRIHVGDRGDHRGAGKRQHGKRPAPPTEKHFSAGEDRAFGE
jgi:hypothetical protein